jgi:hypothetical protein
MEPDKFLPALLDACTSVTISIELRARAAG